MLPSREELLARIAELEASLAAAQARIRELEALVEKATRAGKRQAAPFSKGPPKAHPKKPGRKSGQDYGTKAFRAAPDQIDEVHEAPLPASCPKCGGRIEHSHVDRQYQVEIPRRPIHRQFNVHVGRCRGCGTRVQGRHKLQTSDALGAAASGLGPDAQSAVVYLNKQAGLSHGKIHHLMQALFGIYLSRGGSAQVMLRAGRRCQPTYNAIVAAMPRQPWVVPDETGWRVGGLGAWLHGFVTARLTCYVIARSRGAEVAEAILTAEYQGGMIHDGWCSYDRFLRAWHQQCLGHVLGRCQRLLEAASGAAAKFPRQVKRLLQDALALRDRRDAGRISEHGLAVARGRLEQRLNRLLYWTRSHPGNERLARHMARHQDQWFTFLWHRGIDATNWRAEQALRPAVVNRKVWGGNRTDAGAEAQSILMSVLRTCQQQGCDGLVFIAQALCGRPPQLVLMPAGP